MDVFLNAESIDILYFFVVKVFSSKSDKPKNFNKRSLKITCHYLSVESALILIISIMCTTEQEGSMQNVYNRTQLLILRMLLRLSP